MAGIATITIDQGATWIRTIAWVDEAGTLVDTSTYTARMQVRASATASTSLLELTTENTYITVGKVDEGQDSQYNLLINLPPSATNALTDWGKAVYDLEVVSNTGVVTRLLQGHIYLSMNVTR